MNKGLHMNFKPDDGAGAAGAGSGDTGNSAELFDSPKAGEGGGAAGTSAPGGQSSSAGGSETGKTTELFDDQKPPNPDGEGEGKSEEPKGPPEKYAEFNLPDEYKATVNKDILGKFEGIARELNLNQTQAQKLVDLQVENSRATQATLQKQYEDYVSGLEQETIKEFGADYKQKLAPAAKVFQTYDPDRKALAKLRSFGLDKDPDVLRMLAAQGKDISEDKMPRGGNNHKGSPLDSYFKNSK